MIGLAATDESTRTLLVNRADTYFWWLIVSTIMLFIGAIIEYVNPFEWLKKSKPSLGRTVRASRRWSRSLMVSERMAIAMVVGGIAGEGVFEYLAARSESAVREFDSGVAIVARNRADKAENENLLLRREIEPRRLTGTQRSDLRDLLKTHSTPLAVAFNPFDKEAADFADDFALALSEAHWTPVKRTWVRFKYGVSIGAVDADGRNSPEVKLLTAALVKIGIPNDIVPLVEGESSMDPPIQSHVLYLLIGQHPPIKNSSDTTK